MSIGNHRRRRGTASRGFTIIELLVVLAIMSLLLALTTASLRDSRARSRDAQREADVKSLQNGLALYATNNQQYPATAAEGLYLTGADSVSQALINSRSFSAIPRDPQNTGNYRYHYLSADGNTYTITYHLETSSISGKSAGEQHAAP